VEDALDEDMLTAFAEASRDELLPDVSISFVASTTAGKFVRDAVVRAAQAGMTRGDKTDIAEAS
jgi:hypothetical protein